jgi:hypothetical protein
MELSLVRGGKQHVFIIPTDVEEVQLRFLKLDSETKKHPTYKTRCNPLLIPSPPTDADLETILNYLIKRKGTLDGTLWSAEALTCLQNKTIWTGGEPGIGSLRVFVYPHGVNTEHSWQIAYDDFSGDWQLKQVV